MDAATADQLSTFLVILIDVSAFGFGVIAGALR